MNIIISFWSVYGIVALLTFFLPGWFCSDWKTSWNKGLSIKQQIYSNEIDLREEKPSIFWITRFMFSGFWPAWIFLFTKKVNEKNNG